MLTVGVVTKDSPMATAERGVFTQGTQRSLWIHLGAVLSVPAGRPAV